MGIEQHDDPTMFWIGPDRPSAGESEVCAEVYAWCTEHFGPEMIRWGLCVNLLWFKSEVDACAFKLVWM
jgi:hypothetical protein